MMSNNQMISTANDRVQSLSNSIAQGLQTGQTYVSLLNQLVTTTEATQLLGAVEKLVALNLENAFVKFPQHYELPDYYLLLMTRLLELNDVAGVDVKENETTHQLLAEITPLDAQAKFTFEIDQRSGGAFFAEQHKHEPLFYINLAHKVLKFSNRALVDFFIVRQTANYNDLDLKNVVQPMIKFAQLLESQLDFVIDLGILETSNAAHFRLQKPDLPLTVVDKLFVKTTDTDYMLFSLPHNNGAELRLDERVRLQLAFDPEDFTQEWGFRVLDQANAISFFDVLLHYPLVREWYLENRDLLAVRSDQISFVADDTSTEGFGELPEAPVDDLPTPNPDVQEQPTEKPTDDAVKED